MPTHSEEEISQQAYAAARLSAGPGPCIVALHIGAEQTAIAVGRGALPDMVTLLPMGAERTAREQFRSAPPTPLAMENAIQVVEDGVMPLRPLIPLDALLFSADVGLREIALLSGLAPDATLQLEAMERSFNRLVAVVEGLPDAQLPASNAFAARLLILREFMHHLQFAHIVVLHAP